MNHLQINFLRPGLNSSKRAPQVRELAKLNVQNFNLAGFLTDDTENDIITHTHGSNTSEEKSRNVISQFKYAPTLL